MACSALLVACLPQVSALAAPASSAHPSAAHAHAAAGRPATARAGTQPTSAGPVRLPDPGKVLPLGWQRSSDEAIAVAGDVTGLHVLAATEASGYTWRTVATLNDPAVETNLWIGQACVTASGRYAVVVYTPEQADNMAEVQGVPRPGGDRESAARRGQGAGWRVLDCLLRSRMRHRQSGCAD